MKDKKKLVKEIVTTQVDENGESKGATKRQEFYVNAEPEYVKLYLKDILSITGITKFHHDILLVILREMSWDNTIYLVGPLKKKILKELDVKLITFAKALEHFVDSEILFRQDRGVYLVNPFLFGKGTWDKIKSVRMTVDYKGGKRTIKTEVVKDDKPKLDFSSLQDKLNNS